MFAKINKHALSRTPAISFIYMVCWISGSIVLDHIIAIFLNNPLDPFKHRILLGLWSFFAVMVLILILMKNQQGQIDGLRTRLQDADETLESRVALRTADIEQKFNEVKRLKGIIPICAHCKNIRNEAGQWEEIERYIHRNSEAAFSHGLCPDCNKSLYGDRRLHFESIARKYS